MPELSVVIPFCNEYPMILTTIRSIGEELIGRVDFEVIAVDNWCPEVEAQGRQQDRGHKLVESLAASIPWLKVLKYPHRLSHWQAKNLAVASSDSPYLFFSDAHCIVGRNSLVRAFHTYKTHEERLNGSLHLPVTYHILEERALCYSLRWYPEKAEAHYTFASTDILAEKWQLLDGEGFAQSYAAEVPCMSSCGMMLSRKLLTEKLGGWPTEMGIYGGGENFINFSLAVLGCKKWVLNARPLYHHGEKRGYNWNFWDYERNRLIATYLFGGEDFARRFVENRDKIPSKRKLRTVLDEVVEKCAEQRKLIKSQSVTDIEKWAESWE